MKFNKETTGWISIEEHGSCHKFGCYMKYDSALDTTFVFFMVVLYVLRYFSLKIVTIITTLANITSKIDK